MSALGAQPAAQRPAPAPAGPRPPGRRPGHVGRADEPRVRTQRRHHDLRARGGSPRPVRVRENAARAGPSSSSPASETPPPTMMQDGSKAAVMPASPTPSQRPMSASSSTDSGSPSRAAWVTSGPVSARRVAVDPVVQGVRQRGVGRHQLAGVADQRVAGGVLLPAAPVAALAPVAVRHHLHVPELPRHPVGAAEHPVVDHHRAADAGAERHAEHDAGGRRRRRSGTRRARRCWRRCPRRPASRPGPSPRRAAARRARPGAVRTSPWTGSASTKPAAPTPTASTSYDAAKPCTSVDDGVLDGAEARVLGGPALPRQHAAARSRRRRRAPWCRRCRHRR